MSGPPPRWGEAEKFSKSNVKEQILPIKLPTKDRHRLNQYPDFLDKVLSVRLVKVVLSTGETEILCTSLLNQKHFPIDDFQELYHKRWKAEEAFKMLKSRIELENFSGKTAIAVKQDFYAKMFAITLCSVYSFPIEERVKAEYQKDKQRKHSQKINRTSALGMLRQLLIPSFIQGKFNQAIKAFDDIVSKTREILRPNRSNNRKHKSPKRYYMNYKKL
ncbi:MAG: transposase [Runella zeae]